MALQVQNFPSFTPEKWAAFKQKIQTDTGVSITTNSGIVVHGSFSVSFSYNPTAETLTLQCLKKPLFIKASTIVEGIAEEIAELVPVETTS